MGQGAFGKVSTFPLFLFVVKVAVGQEALWQKFFHEDCPFLSPIILYQFCPSLLAVPG